MEYHALHKKAAACMRLSEIIGWGVVLLILGATRLVLLFKHILLPLWLDLCLLGLVAFAVLFCLLVPPVRYRRYRYHIDPEQVVVVEGLWFISRSIAPMERIHQISVKSGPIDRLYGLAQVEAVTAGGKVTIRFLEKQVADEITDFLQQHIKHIVTEQGQQGSEVGTHA